MTTMMVVVVVLSTVVIAYAYRRIRDARFGTVTNFSLTQQTRPGGMGTAKQGGSKCCELTSGLRLTMARKLPRPLKIVGTALIA
jgi:hypothetical protein